MRWAWPSKAKRWSEGFALLPCLYQINLLFFKGKCDQFPLSLRYLAMDLSFHPETKKILRRTTKSPLTLLQLHFVFKIGRNNGVQTNRYHKHEKGYLKHIKWIQLWNVVIHAWISREFPFPPKKELELVGYVERERLREFHCTFGTFLDHVKGIGLRIEKKNQTDKIQHADMRISV